MRDENPNCIDCWDEAFRRAWLGGGHQAEHYEAIIHLPPAERPWCAFGRYVTKEAPDAEH